MAPQATLVVPTPSLPSTGFPTPAPDVHKPYIPIALIVFLGLCLAYTLSYVVYRTIKKRRHQSEDIPDTPDHGVSQFPNGARLSLGLNFGQSLNRKCASRTPSASPNVPDEEKPLTDPAAPALPEIPASSPVDFPSSPFIILTPSFTHHDLALESHPQEQEQVSSSAETMTPTMSPHPSPHRVASKARFLSRDRAEAIALDPKLAPVQVPLRPLSMVPTPSRKKRVALFGLGFRNSRSRGKDSETHLEVR